VVCGCGSFEVDWKLDCWSKGYRFLVIRQELAEQRKGELQLDLFEPVDWKYEYKRIVTNKSVAVHTRCSQSSRRVEISHFSLIPTVI
jgi:hypothetical protein